MPTHPVVLIIRYVLLGDHGNCEVRANLLAHSTGHAVKFLTWLNNWVVITLEVYVLRLLENTIRAELDTESTVLAKVNINNDLTNWSLHLMEINEPTHEPGLVLLK